MKVRDLIKELKRFPRGAEIKVQGNRDFCISAKDYNSKYAYQLSTKVIFYPLTVNLEVK